MDKGQYQHFMLKEIDEQPEVMRTLRRIYQDQNGDATIGKLLQGLHIPKRIYIVACGTSYHAGLIAKRFTEHLAQVPTEVHVASEFQYDELMIEENSLFLFISQSGETADSRAVLDKVKGEYQTLTITNVEGSTLSRESTFTLLTYAGEEIAIASTKAFTAQIAVVALFALYLKEAKGVTSEEDFAIFEELEKVADVMSLIIEMKEKAQQVVTEYLNDQQACFFVGRLLDYAVSLEGALKLKETSYILAHGYPAGEFRHGPLALVEEGTPIFALTTDARVSKNIRTNLEELQARGAKTCIISIEGLNQEGDAWVLPKVHPLLTPLVAVLPLQMIAYYAALARGLDVDQPRNLTKAVVME